MKKKYDAKKIRIPSFSANPRKIFVLFLFITAQFIFLFSDSFRLKAVEITGINNIKGDDVVSSCAIPWGEYLWRVNASSIHDRLVLLNWVKSSKVTKSFPSSIHIEISERQPVIAMADRKEKRKWYGVDSDGCVLLALTDNEAKAFPKLLTDEKIILNSLTDKNRINGLLNFSKLMPSDIRSKISFYSIDQGGYISFVYSAGQKDFEVRFGNIFNDDDSQVSNEISEKMNILAAMLAQLKNRISMIDYIDLRYAEPVVKFIVPAGTKNDNKNNSGETNPSQTDDTKNAEEE